MCFKKTVPFSPFYTQKKAFRSPKSSPDLLLLLRGGGTRQPSSLDETTECDNSCLWNQNMTKTTTRSPAFECCSVEQRACGASRTGQTEERRRRKGAAAAGHVLTSNVSVNTCSTSPDREGRCCASDFRPENVQYVQTAKQKHVYKEEKIKM